MADNKGSNGKWGMLALGAALAAAGTYFLYGTEKGADSRKKIHGWMLKFKGDVLEELESLKEINEEAYSKVVDTVTQKYEGLKNIDREELREAAADLKRHWKNIKKQIDEAGESKDDEPKKPSSRKKII